jgi:acyl-homoserine-lactone acylase
MTRISRILLLWLALLLSLSAPAASAQIDEPNFPDQPEILWDTWGVPHIYAPDYEGIFYGFGYAQARNHGDLILKLYAESRGRAAEYWGQGFLASDRLVRTMRIPQQAEAAYAELTDEWRSYVDAFAVGFNAYADAHPDLIDADRAAALPVTPVDVLAHGIRTLRYNFMARRGVNFAAAWERGDLASVEPAEMIGSNAWAVGPERSASGHAMLVANPHQPWADLGLWMEAHLVAPGLNSYGAALVGAPVLGIAFNDFLGWTHTVNTHDSWDLYRLDLSEDGSGYIFDGATREFETYEDTILVREEDGLLREEALTIRESVHGPVLAQRDGEALALRVVGENSFEAAQQWWEMGLATDLDQFEVAISTLRLPMFTIMYADRDGNTLMVFSTQAPARDFGDWTTWSNITLLDDDNPAILPGDDPAYLWERDYLPYEALPRLLNPESDWMQNANEPPWTTTLPPPFDLDQFPDYLLPEPYAWPRPTTSMRLMSSDESITFEELVEYKQDVHIELARWVLDDLIAAAQESDDELVQRAAEVLSTWDRRADAESRGAVLFAAWANDFINPRGFAAFAVDWDINDPLNTPRGLADLDAAVESLGRVASQLEALRLLGGGIDVPYGTVFRLRFMDSDYDLPASGAEDLLGTFRTLTFRQDNLRFYPTAGESYTAVIEFSDPIRARVLLPYGNATQPGSPHVGDQLPLFAAYEMRDPWRTREEIEANLSERTALNRD